MALSNKERTRNWRAKHPEYASKWRQEHLEKAREYGRNFMVRKNEKKAGRSRPYYCECCGRHNSKSLVLDHDHSCCERGCSLCFRGWICQPCNLALGCTEDDPDILRDLADYLERTIVR